MAKSAWLAKSLDGVRVIWEQAGESTLMLPKLAARAASAQLCLPLDPERWFGVF